MISWKVKMLLFWHYQKVSQLDPGVKISYDILTPSPLDIFTPPEIIDDKVLFAVHIYFIRSIIKIVSMISWIVKMLLFWHYQNLSELDPGVKILYDILTPPLDILTPTKIDDKVLFAFYI